MGLTEKAATSVLGGTLTATAGVIDELDSGVLPFDRPTIRATIRELKSRRQQLTA